jgi:NAD(P)H-hydrate epimerase
MKNAATTILPLHKATALTHGFIAGLVQPRDAFAHKGVFGHALLIAGSTGKMGAAILAAKACLRSGVGLVTMAVGKDNIPIVQTSIFEAMCVAIEDNTINFEPYAAIGIGPGLGTKDASNKLVKTTLLLADKPLVIDADALNCIALHTADNWLSIIPANAIITPHPKEFDRLFGQHDTDSERIDKAIALSNTYQFVMVLKGHHTLIAYQGKAWYNTTGNAGMAKGGTGDVLTGMLTALLAQKYTAINAALLGVYLHGLAGDITLQQQAIESMLPSDLIDNIGKGFLKLRQ